MTNSMRSYAITALMALLFGFGGAALWSWSGLGDQSVRSYLLANPEILPEMAQALEEQQGAKRLAGIAKEVKTPFPGAVLGNPKGSKVLVEFSDYGCTFCRQSVKDVESMIAADPELKVVIRELPIFEGSEASARMALAAAAQGKFAAFHSAMFAAGDTSSETVDKVAAKVGLDMEAARKTAASEQVDYEIAKNVQFAQQLGIQGTPSWVAGDQMVYGAVGSARLTQALDAPSK